MYKISDFNGTTQGVSSDYPYDQIKDDPGGTEADVVSNGDIQQFFQLLVRQSGITPNSLPDNASNGYQTLQALGQNLSIQAGLLCKLFLSDAYDSTRVYVLFGAGDSSQNGYILYNSKVYYLIGDSSGTSCVWPNVPVIKLNTAPTTGVPITVNGLLSVYVSCATSGTGISNFSDVVRTLYLIDGIWQNIPAQSGGQWDVGAIQTRYKKDKSGNVRMQGQFITLSGSLSTVIATLPVGVRPVVDQIYSCSVYNAASSSFTTQPIKVIGASNVNPGSIVWLNSLPLVAGWFVDISAIHFSTT